MTWGPAGPTAARVRGEAVAVGFTGQAISDAPAWAHRDAAASAVVVELPMRVAAHWETERAAAVPGSPAWRRAMRQHMASLAALHVGSSLLADYRELAAHGGVELGDLVLASEGLGVGLTATERAQLPASPVARYLGAEKPLDAGPGFIGALAVVHAVSVDLADGRYTQAAGRVATLGERAPLLRLVAATTISNYGVEPRQQARAWDTFTSGPYHNIARAQAALAFQQQGMIEEAAARYAALAADYDVHALPASLAMARYSFQASRRGEVGWNIAMGQLRERVLPSDDFDQVVALLSTTDPQPDRMRVLSRASELAAGDRAGSSSSHAWRRRCRAGGVGGGAAAAASRRGADARDRSARWPARAATRALRGRPRGSRASTGARRRRAPRPIQTVRAELGSS